MVSPNATSGVETLTFPSPLQLVKSETYALKILVENGGNTISTNTGFDGLTRHGEITAGGVPFLITEITRDSTSVTLIWTSKRGHKVTYRILYTIDLLAPRADWNVRN